MHIAHRKNSTMNQTIQNRLDMPIFEMECKQWSGHALTVIESGYRATQMNRNEHLINVLLSFFFG